MTRFNITLALIVSVALIGGASWVRFANSSSSQGILSVVTNENELEAYEIPQRELADSAQITTQNSGEMTQTDYISRQFFNDYMILSASDQATPENLESLAELYATSIDELGVATANVNVSEISLVADSDAAFVAYTNALSQVIKANESFIQDRSTGVDTSDILSEKFTQFMALVSESYAKTASSLKNLPVPNSLVDTHINLIKNYLSSAETARILSNISKDPVSVFPALRAQADNMNEEEALLASIRVTLVSRGLDSLGI